MEINISDIMMHIRKVIAISNAILVIALTILHKPKSKESNSSTATDIVEQSNQENKTISIPELIKIILLVCFILMVSIICIKNNITWLYHGFSLAYSLYIIIAIFMCFTEKTDRDFMHHEIASVTWLLMIRAYLLGAIKWAAPYLDKPQIIHEFFEIARLLFNVFCDTFCFTTCLSLVLMSICRRIKMRQLKPFKFREYDGKVHLLEHRFEPLWLYRISIPFIILIDTGITIVKGSLSIIPFIMNSFIVTFNVIIYRWLIKLRDQNDTYVVRLTVKVSIVIALSALYVYISIQDLYSETVKDVFGYFSTVIIIPTIMSQIDSIKEKRSRE